MEMKIPKRGGGEDKGNEEKKISTNVKFQFQFWFLEKKKFIPFYLKINFIYIIIIIDERK